MRPILSSLKVWKSISILTSISILIAPIANAKPGGSPFIARVQDSTPAAIPGAPAGVLPNLDEVKSRQLPQPAAPPSIASTLRSRRNPLAPRTVRRVGDPLPSPLPSISPLPSPLVSPYLPPLGSPTPSPAASAHPTPAPTVLPSPLPSISPHLPLAEFQRTGAKNYAATTESWARGFNRYLLAWNSPYQLRTTNYSTELSIWLDQFQSSSDYVIGSFDFMFVPLPQSGSSKIVFASNRDGNDQIYSMNTDGSSLIRLTSNLSNDEHPRWSPNGTKILFQSDRDDSVSRTHHVYVMNADGSGQTRLTTDATDDCNAEWSGDGTKIVFQSLRNGSYYQIYTMNADGSGQVNVSNGTAADTQPSWSPNGLKIAFDSERDHVGRSSIYVMNANGTNQTRLTFSVDPFMDQGPIWSHDALKLAFVSTRDSTIDTWQETDDDGGIITKSAVRINKEIYSMNVDGSNQVRLTNTLENDDAPAWSPDNTKIVFHSDRERDDSDPP